MSLHLGFTWQESPAILPQLMTAMYFNTSAQGMSGRITRPFWALDYARNHCGRTRVGSSQSPWRERLPGIAHLYPPNTAYWEDTRNVSVMEASYIVFNGGDEAGLRRCIPKKQPYARISDPNGLILEQLHLAAIAGAEKGENGFWEAQKALCAIIQILHQLVPESDDALTIGPTTTTTVSPFVKAVDTFLANRVGGRVSLKELAKAMSVSPSTLSHRYVEEAGRSPIAAFNVMRIEVARSLISRGLKLDAVSAQTGFCNAYHLSKAFTQHFAVSPAAYRHRIKMDSSGFLKQ